MDYTTIKRGEYKIRAVIINDSWWVVGKDLLELIGRDSRNISRSIECVPTTLKKKRIIGKSSTFMLHEKGCRALLAIYSVKDKDVIKFLDYVFSYPVRPDIEAKEAEKKAKKAPQIAAAPVVVSKPAPPAVSLNTLHDALEENQILVENIVQKLQAVHQLQRTPRTKGPVTATVDELNPAANDKIYYIPAKRKEWRLWVNRVIDKLTVKYEGDARTTAGILWDKLYKHVEAQFDIDLRQIMKELNAAANYKSRVKSKVALVNKNDTWMLCMVKYAYEMAVNAEVALPKDFELTKITVPAAARRSA